MSVSLLFQNYFIWEHSPTVNDKLSLALSLRAIEQFIVLYESIHLVKNENHYVKRSLIWLFCKNVGI